jgi:hypothetical protein
MSANEEPPASSSNAGGPEEPDGERLGPEGSDVTAGLQELRDLTLGTLDTEADARRQELLEAALGYARRGLRVIPVQWLYPDGSCACPRGAECPSAAKHPVHDDWPEVATTDPELISRWWRPEASRGVIVREWFPFANIGIVTGRASGIFVLDVDQYAGGMQSLAGYERRNGELPETRVHSTGRGGTHYFFAHPGFDVRNSAAKVLGKGLDIRGEHGFVVAPPSRSSHGAYELNPAHDIAPVPAPDWLLDILRSHDKGQSGSALSGQMVTEATGAARRYAEAAVRAEAEKMRNAGEGSLRGRPDRGRDPRHVPVRLEGRPERPPVRAVAGHGHRVADPRLHRVRHGRPDGRLVRRPAPLVPRTRHLDVLPPGRLAPRRQGRRRVVRADDDPPPARHRGAVLRRLARAGQGRRDRAAVPA